MNEPTTTLPIVVGIDGSASADLALDWAAAQAAAEQRSLVLLVAVPLPLPESSAWLATHGVNDGVVRTQLKEGARAVCRRATQRVHETYPDLDVRADLEVRDPRDALLEVDADLVVVGTRGLGPIRRLILGSVVSTIVKHATRPTIVVRPRHTTAADDGVVVGIAGDAGDAAAVDLAFRVAASRGLPVTAFHALWDVVGPDERRNVSGDAPEYAEEQSLFSDALDPATRRYPEVEVRRRIGRGFADERLINASRSAELLVVGHRRKPFLNELVYGSAAPRIVEHARCSVAVTPYQEQGAMEADRLETGTTA